MWLSVYGLPTTVFAGYLFAILAPSLAKNFKQHAGEVITILPLVISIYFLSQVSTLSHEPSIQTIHPWSDLLGVALSFSLDGLSMLFALVISFIGTLIMIYSGDYLAKDSDAGRLFSLLLTFMASMLGAARGRSK